MTACDYLFASLEEMQCQDTDVDFSSQEPACFTNISLVIKIAQKYRERRDPVTVRPKPDRFFKYSRSMPNKTQFHFLVTLFVKYKAKKLITEGQYSNGCSLV